MIKNNLELDRDIEDNYTLLSRAIRSKSILVIGGAGTIGSNYIKQILMFKPAQLTVVDINENGLTELTRDLRSSGMLDYNPGYFTYPVDLLSDTFNKVFDLAAWDVVANFSAHKHVRSEKDKISIEALIRNNVYGAIKLLKLCETRPPKYFFSVSTDKAANPVNVMGASKSLMEKLILSKKDMFRVSTARFANVAFSNGSLLDGFVNRMKKRQPIACPQDIKRFFVSPSQSGQICLLATFLGSSGDIFFPKLDFAQDQIYFKDIALDFLKTQGFKPKVLKSEQEAKQFNFDAYPGMYPIYLFNSDTSGEKAFEEFYTYEESFELNNFHSLGFIVSARTLMNFDKILHDFDKEFNLPNRNKADLISTLAKYVPSFRHKETGKNLDEKM